MINDFPKKYIEKIDDFIKAHEKTLNPGNYDMTKTALEQGYTPEFIMQEIQEITKQAKGIIREAGRYTCSKHDDYSSSLLIRFRDLVNTALETLYRIPHVILIENPEKKNEILALLDDENSKRVMLNTKPDINVYRRKIECGVSRYYETTKIIDDIDELLEEGRKGFDRLTGGNIKDTDKLVLEFATNFRDLDVALDETMPIVLGHIDRTDPRIQKYLSLVCDENLLNKENFKQLYSNTIGMYESEKIKTSEFWRDYSKIRDYVLSEDNISQVSPRYIKLVLTIEYGSE